MCSEEVEAELQAIQAIYCCDGEFILRQKYSGIGENQKTIVTVTLKSEMGGNEQVSVTYTLDKDYPQVIPDLSVASDGLTREICSKMKQDALKYISDHNLVCQPMIMDVNMWLQQNMSKYFECFKISVSSDAAAIDKTEHAELWYALLHLDHMRAKNKYIKTVEKWTSELGLTGHLIFSDKLILILLCGWRQNIKYVKLQKTVNVDVDSKGRSCKERMVSVLIEEPISGESRFTRFSVLEVQPEKLKNLFEEWTLGHVYEMHVETIIRR